MSSLDFIPYKRLEQEIDRHGLDSLLVQISNICLEKAEFIRQSAGRGSDLALRWQQLGRCFDTIAAGRLP